MRSLVLLLLLLVCLHQSPVEAFSRLNSKINLSGKKSRPLANSLKSLSSCTTEVLVAQNPSSLTVHGVKFYEHNIPNSLTIARLVSIPLFVALSLKGQNYYGGILFAIASFTDWLDGYLARKWNQTSEFGAFFDPVADKLIVAAAILRLLAVIDHPLFSLFSIVLITREIAISSLREYMAQRGLRNIVKVGSLGKWKTALQMISITVLLMSREENLDLFFQTLPLDFLGIMPASSFISPMIGGLLYGVASLLSLISGVEYFYAAWKTQ